MLYLLHGDNEFERAEALARLRAELTDPAFGDLNTLRLDGKRVSLVELTHACDVVPFFGARLVIVDGLLTRLASGGRKADRAAGGEAEASEGGKAFAAGLANYLPRLPDTTHLILVEPKAVARTNAVLKAAQSMGDRAQIRAFDPLNARRGEVGDWLRDRARRKGGSLQPPAVRLLEETVGGDLRALDTELDKLLTYVGSDRPISEADVRQMVGAAQQTSIFEMVDAVGSRDTGAALARLHELLDAGEAPLYLLFMITRQFRILLQLRLLQAANLSPAELASRLGLHPFVAEKGLRQAQRFTAPQLEAILRRLLAADLALKSSGNHPVLELDLLIVSLTRGQPVRPPSP